MLTESQVVPPPVVPAKGASPKTKLQKPGNGDSADAIGSVDEEKSFASKIDRANHLFEIISARSDIDHPICTECTDLLIEGLQKRLNTTTKERDAYITFLKKLAASTPSAEEVTAAEAALASTEQTERETFEELLALEAEKATLDAECAALEEESRALDAEEEKFWRERNAFALNLSTLQSTRDSLTTKYAHDALQLERLQRTNVYNDTFCIGHDGFFGTINGLRLGRLTSPAVEWNEINAAWGQTLLLLATVAEKLGFQFQGYRLRPMGSTSRIDRLDHSQQSPQQSRRASTLVLPDTASHAAEQQQPKVTTLDLFSSGDVALTRIMSSRRFDAGMVAFLDCLNQLGQHVYLTSVKRNPGSPGLRLPYPITKDKVGDVSIKLGAGFNQDESWTKACKCALTNCKFLLAHASNVSSGKASG